ncbi:MAG: indole-3-glycerol phosphate synthase / phosphoribosylanthranilate isomerase [Sphingomonadales bacterium]|jgi:indole-3-glycerol phosphate synthase/phosphoribosylanthranilate isomerase|nr:indole-3-glycerol phosphate synthase / phosphoribosylanthranilate isomerase [Sphingomonadales bacterium]
MAEAAGVLGEIVARKKQDVAARLAGIDLAALRAQAEPTRRSLRAALARPGARFIMEVKRASPSQGKLRAEADPAAIARAYAGAADAISVLTDNPYFGGSLDDLRAVRAVFAGPILAKDFIVDPRQVPEARLHGADAVLAILAVLSDDEAQAVMAEAERLGMDVLVEAHDEAEVRRAVALGATVIGINNRNLKTLEIDLAVTARLAGLVPADRLVVAESGIDGRADVERLAPFADAFLVGSSLMRAPDPALAARALAFGRVKICGLTGPGDARLAAAQGASFLGMVMVPNTPRAVTMKDAEAIAEAAAAPLVGVFRNEKPMEVASRARALRLHAVQLHGEEDAAYVRGLRALLPEATEIWTVAAIGREVPEPPPGADRTLFDSKIGGRSGGTGIAFDWARLDGRDLGRAILAGGLNPENAGAAAGLGTYALDVASGVEAAPGRKDPERMRAFFEALRLPVRAERAPC